MHQSNLVKALYDAIPSYNGDGDVQKLLEFIDKLESYFEMVELSPTSQLQAAALKLTGTASLLWCHHRHMYNKDSLSRIKTWNGLKELLKKNKITSEHERQVLAQLQKIQQTGSVHNYNITFDKLMMQITEVPLKVEMHFYLQGLKPELHQIVESNANNLEDIQ